MYTDAVHSRLTYGQGRLVNVLTTVINILVLLYSRAGLIQSVDINWRAVTHTIISIPSETYSNGASHTSVYATSICSIVHVCVVNIVDIYVSSLVSPVSGGQLFCSCSSWTTNTIYSYTYAGNTYTIV